MGENIFLPLLKFTTELTDLLGRYVWCADGLGIAIFYRKKSLHRSILYSKVRTIVIMLYLSLKKQITTITNLDLFIPAPLQDADFSKSRKG